ncbi:MAG: DUF2007 domain-containing protein [Myxococcota bacterium]
MPYLSPQFSSRAEANLALQILEVEGITARISASDAGGAIPSMQAIAAVRVEVAAEDVERAESLISDFVGHPRGRMSELSASERNKSRLALAIFLALLAIICWNALRQTDNQGAGRIDVRPDQQIPW